MNSMKNIVKALCTLLALILILPACSAGSGESSGESSEKLLPITINGTEIRIGETTVQALLDQGMNVGWVDENYERVDVDPSMELEPNAYYTGGSINVSENVFAHISFVTEDKAVPLGEAVIARLEFSLVGEEDKSVLEKIAFDGVPITELTREKAGEMYPDWTGNEVMWLHYGLEYKYDLNFDISSGNLSGFTVERTYDVDWNS